MASHISVLCRIITDGLHADFARRSAEVKKLMDDGLSWREAYRRVNWPWLSEEEWNRRQDENAKGFPEEA